MFFLRRQLRNFVLFRSHRFQHTQPKVRDKASQSPVIVGSGPVFRAAKSFADRIAIRDGIANYTYANIFLSAHELSKEIRSWLNYQTNERVLFLCPNDVQYVITLWAIWLSGQIAVPLSPLHPKNLLLYYANDTSSKLLITTSEYSDLMQRVTRNTGGQLHVLDDKLKLNCTLLNATSPSDLEGGQSNDFYSKSDALILYTSGTTGNPKGVVLSHNNLHAQATTLLDAWRWNSDDVLLHTLPLHHVHGIVNALLCPLYVGAKTVMLKKFEVNEVWGHFLGVNTPVDNRKITVYMGVPTMYSKLVEEYDRVFKPDPKMVEYIKNNLKSKMRVMISGSSPLPVSLYNRWFQLSGHKLLERYGMTETGMILSNPYDSDREPGYVGAPLPGVSVKVVEPENPSNVYLDCTNTGNKIVYKKTPAELSVTGELLVKGEAVFKGYYNRPEATKEAFTNDGWFKTGDVVEYQRDKQRFKIVGRRDIDIVKSGGYKISTLDIETQLLSHPKVKECAVLGVKDDALGQKLIGILVWRQDPPLLEELITYLEESVPKYYLPREWKILSSLPRNAMGKVNKKEIAQKLLEEKIHPPA